MKLTKEYIQFIDNYLKNSEVIYYDIRMEMLDHVATAVEKKMQAEDLDFYDAFKSYMVVNKKGLMEQNEKTLKFNYSVVVTFLKYCLKLTNLFVFVICNLLFYFAIQNYSILFVNRFIIGFVFIGILFWVFYNFYVYHYKKKKRFYSIEKNGVIMFIAYQPIQFFHFGIVTGKDVPSLISGLILTFYLSWFIVFVLYNIEEIKKTEIKNKHLFQ